MERVEDYKRYELKWNLETDKPITTINSIISHHLDRYLPSKEVRQSKAKETRNRRTYSFFFVMFFGNQCVVALATHDFNTRRTELSVGRKHKTFVKGMRLTDEQLFPMPLTYDGLEDTAPWKLILNYDKGAKKFKLSVDGIDFFKLAFQGSAEADGPSFISGNFIIRLNGNRIEMDQWSPIDFHLINNDLNTRNPTTKVNLSDIDVSSAEVFNQLVYEIAETVAEDGLTELTLDTIDDFNGTIEPWPMTLLEHKSANL